MKRRGIQSDELRCERSQKFIASNQQENKVFPIKCNQPFNVFIDPPKQMAASKKVPPDEHQTKGVEKNEQEKRIPLKITVRRQPLSSLGSQSLSSSITSQEPSQTQTSIEDDDSIAFRNLANLPCKRQPLAPVGRLFFDDDLSRYFDSPMVVNDDDAESEYISAYSEYSDSDYLTAPPITEKERHSDLIYCQREFADDIYCYMRARESRLRPRTTYMLKQKDINEEMRTILVDWLVDVTAEYDLQLETLHTTVDIVDRMLSVVECPRAKLQLVGATAMMIASKYEEIYPPELKEFVFITDDTYKAPQVLAMERAILKTLQFEIATPTSHWFCSWFLKMSRASTRTIHLANYLLELALLDYSFLPLRPSELAAASVCLSNLMTGPTPWPLSMEMNSQITLVDMYPCLISLLRAFRTASRNEYKGVFEKYSQARYQSVALLESPDSLPQIC